jgi:hypothetical protein
MQLFDSTINVSRDIPGIAISTLFQFSKLSDSIRPHSHKYPPMPPFPKDSQSQLFQILTLLPPYLTRPRALSARPRTMPTLSRIRLILRTRIIPTKLRFFQYPIVARRDALLQEPFFVLGGGTGVVAYVAAYAVA